MASNQQSTHTHDHSDVDTQVTTNDDRLQMELLSTQLRLAKQEHEFALLQAKNDVLEEERTRLLALSE